MNLAQLLIALLVVAFGVAAILRLRKSGATNLNPTNLLLLIIIGMGGFGFHLYTESEDREAIRTSDYDRCWSGSCTSEVARQAGERLARGRY
jgi:hypothetical protein